MNVATVTNNAVSIPTDKGWYIDLTLNSGERVVNPPVIKNGTLDHHQHAALEQHLFWRRRFLRLFHQFRHRQFLYHAAIRRQRRRSYQFRQADTVGATHIVPVGVLLGTGFYAGATLEHTASCTGPSGCTSTPTPPGNLGYWCQAGNATCTPRIILGSKYTPCFMVGGSAMKLSKLSVIAATAAVMLSLQSTSVWRSARSGLPSPAKSRHLRARRKSRLPTICTAFSRIAPRPARPDLSSSGRQWMRFLRAGSQIPNPRWSH